MELERLRRIVAARWRIILVAAVAASVVAGIGTAQRNSNLKPRFVATAIVKYERDPLDVSGEERQAQTEQAYTRAQEADRDLLLEDPLSSITYDDAIGQLSFTAEAETAEEARQEAQVLRDTFLASEEQSVTEGLTKELASIQDRIVNLQREVDDLNQLTPDQIDRNERLKAIRAQITEYQNAATTLRVERVNPTADRPLSVIDAELERIQTEVVKLEQDAASLEAQDADERVQQEVRASTLTQLINGLQSQYVELFLRQVGLTGSAQEAAIQAIDASPQPASVAGLGLLGMIAGVVFGLGALVASDRFRPMVWMASDVTSVRALGLIPSRVGGDGSVWYIDAPPGARKVAIQRVRSALEPRLGTSKVVALSEVSGELEELALLAVDLGASLSVTGRRVLVLNPTAVGVGGEYLQSTVDINDLLGRDRINEQVLRASEIHPGLHVVNAGKKPIDADVAASTNFRLLLDRLRNNFDVILVVAGGADGSAGQSIVQQAHNALIASRPGGISSEDLEAFIADVRERNVAIVGLALIGSPVYRTEAFGTSEARPEAPSRQQRTEARPAPVQAPAPVGIPTDDVLLLELIETLEESEPYRVVDAIEQFLAERMSTIVSNASRMFDRGAAREPFIWLGPGSNVEEVLRTDFVNEFGQQAADALVDALVGVLRRSLHIESLNDWIGERFFDAHLRETAGEPSIWFLTAAGGRFGALVDGDRFTASHLEVLRARSQSAIQELESEIRHRPRDQRPYYETLIEEMQIFGLKLGVLAEGKAPEARIYYPGRAPEDQPTGWQPDLSENRLAHLVPVQRLGLIPRPVLSEEMLERYRAA